MLHRAIGFIESLPRKHRRNVGLQSSSDRPLSAAHAEDDAEDVDITSVDSVETATEPLVKESTTQSSKTDSLPVHVAQMSDDASLSPPDPERLVSCSAGGAVSDSDAELERWSIEEKDRLFQFVAKVFLTNFPLYIALKHCIHTSLEDLSKHDASALNNYCELSVCSTLSFFCYIQKLTFTRLPKLNSFVVLNTSCLSSIYYVNLDSMASMYF